MDHPYTFWEQAPLKWHKFITYVALPLGLVTKICSLPSILETISGLLGSGVAWLGMIDLLYTLSYIVLSAAAICGNLPRNRKWFGPQCTIALYAVSALYLAFIILLSILFQTWEESLASNLGPFLVYAIGAWLVAIYYRKRRLLFRPIPSVSRTLPKQPIVGTVDQAPVPPSESDSCVDLLIQLQGKSYAEGSSAEETVSAPSSSHRPTGFTKKKVLFGCGFLFLELLLLSGCYLYASKMVEAQMQAEIEKSYYDGWAEGYDSGIEYGKELSNDINDTSSSNVSKEWQERYSQALQRAAEQDAEWERSREEHWGSRIVYVTKNGEKYHTDGCSYLTGSEEEITVRQALEDGYTPCSRCDPPLI